MSTFANLYHFEGLSGVVEMVNCDTLLGYFPVIFPGWNIYPVQSTVEQPVLSLVHKSDGYQLDGHFMDEPLRRRDEADVICGFVAELVRASVMSNRKQLCLHGASVEFNGRLVVFPSVYRAGKSVLSACLSASGKTLFGDDVLPIDMETGDALAPGLSLRLRLPLPDNLSASERAFIDSRLSLRGKRYGYLAHRDGELATRGSRLPIGAFVLLQRQDGIGAELSTLPASEVLRQVLWQNFAREADASDILHRLQGLVASARFYRLRYDRASDAVALLSETFGNWEAQPQTPLAIDSERPDHGSLPAVAPGEYARSPDLHVVTLDQEKFLADSAGDAIYHLNMIGGAIWHLLQTPQTVNQLTSAIHAAFPDIDKETVQDDVNRVLEDLVESGLAIRGD